MRFQAANADQTRMKSDRPAKPQTGTEKKAGGNRKKSPKRAARRKDNRFVGKQTLVKILDLHRKNSRRPVGEGRSVLMPQVKVGIPKGANLSGPSKKRGKG